MSLPEGAGTLTCRVESVPLVAGTYALTAAIMDLDSRLPLAEIGREGELCELVIGAELSETNNTSSYLDTIVALEASWEPN